MSTISPIKAGMPCPRPEGPNEGLVKVLREVLADAEAGVLRNFIGAGAEIDGVTTRVVVAGEMTRSRFMLLGGIEHAKAVAMKRLFPEDVKAGDL